jgi:hypothetical protein
VEVAGVEPASAKADLRTSTSIVCLFDFRLAQPRQTGYGAPLTDGLSVSIYRCDAYQKSGIGHAHQSHQPDLMGVDGLALS